MRGGEGGRQDGWVRTKGMKEMRGVGMRDKTSLSGRHLM